MFIVTKASDKGQHGHGKLYPWAPGTNLSIKGELETFCQSLGKAFQTTYMDNRLRVFEDYFWIMPCSRCKTKPW